jgi:hypothetical protein
MKTLLALGFSATVLVGGVTVLVATNALSGPPGGNPPGLNGVVNPGFGGTPPGLQRKTGAVPIPDTLLLFAGGLAGLVGWQWINGRRRAGESNA